MIRVVTLISLRRVMLTCSLAGMDPVNALRCCQAETPKLGHAVALICWQTHPPGGLRGLGLACGGVVALAHMWADDALRQRIAALARLCGTLTRSIAMVPWLSRRILTPSC